MGTFKQQGREVFYEDEQIDEMYDTLRSLQIDAENKLEELRKEYDKLEKEFAPIRTKYYNAEIDDEGFDELEETFMEMNDKVDALERVIGNLEDLIDKINY